MPAGVRERPCRERPPAGGICLTLPELALPGLLLPESGREEDFLSGAAAEGGILACGPLGPRGHPGARGEPRVSPGRAQGEPGAGQVLAGLTEDPPAEAAPPPGRKGNGLRESRTLTRGSPSRPPGLGLWPELGLLQPSLIHLSVPLSLPTYLFITNFYLHPKTGLLTLERGEGQERGRERVPWGRGTLVGCPSRPRRPPRCSCPDRELNPRPFGFQDGPPANRATLLGPHPLFIFRLEARPSPGAWVPRAMHLARCRWFSVKTRDS